MIGELSSGILDFKRKRKAQDNQKRREGKHMLM